MKRALTWSEQWEIVTNTRLRPIERKYHAHSGADVATDGQADRILFLL